MADRQVKVSLLIDDHGSVRVMRQAGDESYRTEGKLHHLDRGVKELGKSFGGLKGMIGAGLGALGVGGVAYGLKDIVSTTGELAGEVEHFHAVSGVGAQQSLLLAAALKARGLSAEQGAKAFSFMTKNLQMAERQWKSYGDSQLKASEKGHVATTQLGLQATAFKELGLNVGQLAAMSGEEKLETVVKAFENMPDSMRKAGDAGRLMKQIFGRGGESLATVLEGGAMGLTHFTEQARKFFPQIKGGQRGLEEWEVKQGEFKLATEGLEFTLGMKLVPVIEEVEDALTKVVYQVEHGQGTWGEFRHTIEGIAHFAGGAFGFIKKIADALGVHLTGNTLGAVLAAAATAEGAKHLPGAKTASKSGKLLKKAGKYALAHPELAPFILAGAAATAYGVDVYENRDELAGNAEGAFNMLTGRLGNGTILGGRGYKPIVQGRTSAGGEARGGGETPAEAALVAKVIEAMNPHANQTEFHLHIDAAKVAEATVRNPRAARILAEAVAHYTSKMAARGVK